MEHKESKSSNERTVLITVRTSPPPLVACSSHKDAPLMADYLAILSPSPYAYNAKKTFFRPSPHECFDFGNSDLRNRLRPFQAHSSNTATNDH